MMFYAQVVAEAVYATPPRVRGLIDGQTIRRLRGFRGSGPSRVFEFDIAGAVTARVLLRRKELVALSLGAGHVPMILASLSDRQSAVCPSCGLEMLSLEFWIHYNMFHARRACWLNKEHWSSMGLAGAYTPPPEQR